MARPSVLMFGDVGWGDSRTSAQESRFEAWLADVTRTHGRLAIVECGAGMAIPTVRRLGETLARQSAAILVRINPRDPRAPTGAISIAAGALEALNATEACVTDLGNSAKTAH